MNINSHRHFAEIPLTREQWNALIARSSTNTIFQTHQWATAWWHSLGNAHHLHCLTAETGQNIHGLAAMMSHRSSPREWLFLADSNSDYCDFPITGNRYATLESFLEYFMRNCPDWNSLALHNIPEQSTTLACLLTLCERHGLHYRIGKRIAAPEIVFGDVTHDYKPKYSVRRHCSRLEKLGQLQFDVVQDPHEIAGMLEVLYRQHIARFREKGERSLFEDQANRNFYARLAQELAGTGWLHFSRLSLDGTPLALHFGFEYNGTLTWYKPSFDIAYSHYSPGTVLIKHLIDYVQEHRLRILDFTIGDESFKSRFSNSITYNRNLVIYRNRHTRYWQGVKHVARCLNKRSSALLGRQHASG